MRLPAAAFLEFAGCAFYGRGMSRDLPTLKVETPQPHVLQVTMSRPEVANAMNTQMGLDLMHCFEDLALDPGDTRCVVLTGAGEKAFCAGGDLKERNGMTDEQWQAQHLLFERMIRAFVACPVPVIGAVNGAAYAGGCELALCCDFLYAAETARFALTEVTLGIMPGAGGTQNLPRAVGERRAKEIILTGRPFTAREAFEWGMVNRLCAADKLLDETLETARRIADNAPISVRQAKQSIRYGLQMDLASGMMFEIEAYNRMVPTEDRREGIASFNEKRKPRFQGR
jgi:enoyl-CoA hydratase/carnithine racemase